MSTSPHSRPSQSEKILRHMRSHGSITPREAMEEFGCYRLAARIHELKAEGHGIECDKSEGFARYSLALPVQLSLAI